VIAVRLPDLLAVLSPHHYWGRWVFHTDHHPAEDSYTAGWLVPNRTTALPPYPAPNPTGTGTAWTPTHSAHSAGRPHPAWTTTAGPPNSCTPHLPHDAGWMELLPLWTTHLVSCGLLVGTTLVDLHRLCVLAERVYSTLLTPGHGLDGSRVAPFETAATGAVNKTPRPVSA